jgi:hypothetical protein
LDIGSSSVEEELYHSLSTFLICRGGDQNLVGDLDIGPSSVE